MAKLSPALSFIPSKTLERAKKMTLMSLLLWYDRCDRCENETFFLSSPASFVNAAAFFSRCFYGQDLPIVFTRRVLFISATAPRFRTARCGQQSGFAVTENSHFIKSLPMADAWETSASLLSFFLSFNEWKAKFSPTHEPTKISPELACLFSFLI